MSAIQKQITTASLGFTLDCKHHRPSRMNQQKNVNHVRIVFKGRHLTGVAKWECKTVDIADLVAKDWNAAYQK